MHLRIHSLYACSPCSMVSLHIKYTVSLPKTIYSFYAVYNVIVESRHILESTVYMQPKSHGFIAYEHIRINSLIA